MRRSILLIPILLVLLAAAAFWWLMRPLPVLTVVTWPGIYGRAQAAAQMQPYAAAKRIDVRIAQWEGKLDDLRQTVKSGHYNDDVIDFELPEAVRACREGLLEPLDAATLPPGDDGTPARNDFIPGAIGPCWVASIAYTQMIIDRPAADWSGAAPNQVADFFDLKKYPGPRALVRTGAKYTLELALLADGAAPRDVYRLLGTPAGLDRAFARLDSLKGHIVWLDSAAGAIAALQEGRANFALANNGDIVDAAAKGFAPATISAGQMVEFDVFGIPRGDPRKVRAQDFIRDATGTKALAGVAGWVPYSPARRSSWPLVGRNPISHQQMRGPLDRNTLPGALVIDDAWWQTKGAAAEARWRAWAAD